LPHTAAAADKKTPRIASAAQVQGADRKINAVILLRKQYKKQIYYIEYYGAGGAGWLPAPRARAALEYVRRQALAVNLTPFDHRE